MKKRKEEEPSHTRWWSQLKPSVMLGDKTRQQKQLGNTRGIPKTHRVLASTKKKQNSGLPSVALLAPTICLDQNAKSQNYLCWYQSGKRGSKQLNLSLFILLPSSFFLSFYIVSQRFVHLYCQSKARRGFILTLKNK